MCSRTEQVAEEFDECPDIDVELVGVTISRPMFLIQLSQLVSYSMLTIDGATIIIIIYAD